MTSVSASAPRIGFDRFLALDWVSAAMRVRAGVGSREELVQQLDEAGLTLAARKKTLTLLNRLWLEPRAELEAFSGRGIEAWKTGQGIAPAAMAWAMTVAAYPFFAKVAELVGRLTALQGDCRASEVHRRMEELFGQREGTRRMTNMALQTQADWGAIERTERGQKIVRCDPIRLSDDRLVGWLLESALLYAGRAIPAASVGSMAVLYPFLLERPLAMVIAQADQLELRYHGPGEQVLGLRA
ncbi:hypothetical protein [Diaphorobacter sp.]|uniref:hypothetical protein n=1 Tax=Diaphorobacter sp. TaxID=1934310 RepID=UPI0025881F39|nr:hypothetical protein [Diaphorobacter sp.]